MRSSIMKLILSFVLSVAVWSCALADKVVKIENVESNVPENSVISSCDTSVENNTLNAVVVVEESCPGTIGMEMNIYQDETLVQTFSSELSEPMEDIKKQKTCKTTKANERDDDNCSMCRGRNEVTGCDLTPIFDNCNPGNYICHIIFTSKGDEITRVIVRVLVEDE